MRKHNFQYSNFIYLFFFCNMTFQIIIQSLILCQIIVAKTGKICHLQVLGLRMLKMSRFKHSDIIWVRFESLDPPLSSQEQCCISKGVSEECLVLCRKDPNYEDSPNYDDTKFPEDTPCEKHKSAISECWRVQGILDAILIQISEHNSIFKCLESLL